MLAKPKEQQQAIALRKQGLSYDEISKIIPVSSSSLSLWLRHIPLTTKQKYRLKDISQGAGARARREQRLTREQALAKELIKELPKLLNDHFFLFGLALYWAEGSKQKPWNISQRVTFSNSDHTMILLMRKWFFVFGNITEKDIVYYLHIHSSADSKKAQEEWSKLLHVDPQKIRTSFKKHEIKNRHPQDSYKGLTQMQILKSTWLNRRIGLWTKHAAEVFLAQ